MDRLLRVSCLSIFAVVCCGTPCAAQRDGVPHNLCQGLANIATAECFVGEYRKSNDELKALLFEIRETLEPEDKHKLDEAQKSWQNYRDLTCDIESRVYFDQGTGEGTEATKCLYVETRLQIKDLHAIYDWVMRPDR